MNTWLCFEFVRMKRTQESSGVQQYLCGLMIGKVKSWMVGGGSRGALRSRLSGF